MAIETLTPPKTSFAYEWTCCHPPCGATLRAREGDAANRSLLSKTLGFDCPHCARRTFVELREP